MGLFISIIALILAIYLLIVGIKTKNKKYILGAILIIAFILSGTFWVTKEVVEFDQGIINMSENIK